MRYVILFLTILVVGNSHAFAELVTKCGSSKGYSFYPQGGLVSNKDAGWTEDAISNGSFLVTKTKKGEYDVIFSDASGRTISSRDDGGEVILISKSKANLILLVAYPQMNVVTYYFRIDQRGVGDVSYSSARYGEAAMVNKHGLLVAACSK